VKPEFKGHPGHREFPELAAVMEVKERPGHRASKEFKEFPECQAHAVKTVVQHSVL
jgi:hypothetical protein